MTHELKACPFCGVVPQIEPQNPKVEGNAWGRVKCINLNCPAMPEVLDGEMVSDDRGSEKYKKAAIRRWNRRLG